MEPVRCALVGHGMIGVDHAKILANVPEADLLVVCDLDRPHREERHHEHREQHLGRRRLA